ncbi:hypothetical protein B296_00048588 [Ensete ventricosum]|uniref:Uncharacterized protein n=1 Tax=Ensete ventricosum TaxID=4639 RepID=A0A426Y9F7_ENSVE|nr:hypothetical protein B296_00048588 [Ensete ventricosum]
MLTCESPFSLAFDTKAALPPKVVFPTLRIESFEEDCSNRRLRENLDLLEEWSIGAHLRTLAYKQVVFPVGIVSRKLKVFAPLLSISNSSERVPYSCLVMVRCSIPLVNLVATDPLGQNRVEARRLDQCTFGGHPASTFGRHSGDKILVFTRPAVHLA